jgi:hypothetical protein
VFIQTSAQKRARSGLELANAHVMSAKVKGKHKHKAPDKKPTRNFPELRSKAKAFVKRAKVASKDALEE